MNFIQGVNKLDITEEAGKEYTEALKKGYKTA